MATPTSFDPPAQPAIAPGKAVAMCRYGYFEPDSFEFVVTDVLTPRPWINVMANGRYGLVVSQIGGGFSWADNCQLERITRWEQDLALDSYGRWIYVGNPTTGEIHSTTFAPVRERAEIDEVRHGLGYTVFRRTQGDLETRQTVFVPLEGSCEHTIVEVLNHGGKPLEVVLGSYLEWQLGQQGEWHREFHRLFISVEAVGSALLAWKRLGLEENTRSDPTMPLRAYAAVAGLDQVEWFSDKAQWIGRAGRLGRPEGLLSVAKPVVTGRWDDPIAAFRSPATVPPRGVIRFALTIGAEANRSEALVAAQVDLQTIERRLDDTKRHHRQRAGSLQIQSAEPAFDAMNDAWLPYQAEIGRMTARCAYYQQGGAYGFRDQLQDSLSLLDTDPPSTLKQIETNARAMYEDGGVRHWWHPGTDIYADSRHSDTCLWLAFATLEYLDETADFGALEKPEPYLSRQAGSPGRTDSLLEHCLRGIERMLENRSHRGLPLIGGGDWNDGLSHAGLDGKGESVWLAMFAYGVLTHMADVLERIGSVAKAARLRTEAASLQTAVETHGWDGDWYIGGTSDNGQPFGSHSCPEGAIFLNPQSWSVITGVATPERARRAMESVQEHLVKPYGALLLHPAYRTVDPFVGYITRYAPGLRENGGVYSHASTWAVQAFAQLGDIETAYAIYKGMMPPLRAAHDADAYQAEPYVMPGNVDGPDSPYEGRAGWTWYTGSAAWMRRVALHWLLGIRPTFEGLRIEPELPQGLGPVKLIRPFRGDVFEIELHPGEGNVLTVDGRPHNGGGIAASGQGMRRKAIWGPA